MGKKVEQFNYELYKIDLCETMGWSEKEFVNNSIEFNLMLYKYINIKRYLEAKELDKIKKLK